MGIVTCNFYCRMETATSWWSQLMTTRTESLSCLTLVGFIMKCKRNTREEKRSGVIKGSMTKAWHSMTNRNLGNVTRYTVHSKQLQVHFLNYEKYLSMHCEYDETAKNPQLVTYWEADPCGVSTHGSKRMQFATAIHWALYVRNEGSPSSRTAAALQFPLTDLHPQSTSWYSCYTTK